MKIEKIKEYLTEENLKENIIRTETFKCGKMNVSLINYKEIYWKYGSNEIIVDEYLSNISKDINGYYIIPLTENEEV